MSRRLYHPSLMAGDAANLLDHLGIGRRRVIGYSMGGRIAAFLAVERSAAGAGGDPRRHRHEPRRRAAAARRTIAAALLAPNPRRSPTRPAAPTGSSPTRRRATCRALAACIVGQAREPFAGAARRHRGAGAGCGRHARRQRRLGGRACGAYPAAPRCSTSPTATTCSRPATRCSRRAPSTSSPAVAGWTLRPCPACGMPPKSQDGNA